MLHSLYSPNFRVVIYFGLTVVSIAMLSYTILGLGAGTSFAALVSGAATTLSGGRIPVNPELQRILDQAYQEPLYKYPTAITQGIVPKALYSHNDYWQPVPFYTALSHGCICIEADVHLISGELYVAHERAAISPTRTLSSLYINPLLSVLNSTNPHTPFYDSSSSPPSSFGGPDSPSRRNGVYDGFSAQTLYFIIDVKTEGDEPYAAVLQALAPLRDGGWLSRLESDGTFVPGAVTAVAGGRTPRTAVEKAGLPRDLFWDAYLQEFGGEAGGGDGEGVSGDVALLAAMDFELLVGEGWRGPEMNDTLLKGLRAQIEAAHRSGIMVRYWNTPSWPVSTRNAVWRTLWREGVDFLNVDDIEAAAGLDWWAGGDA